MRQNAPEPCPGCAVPGRGTCARARAALAAIARLGAALCAAWILAGALAAPAAAHARASASAPENSPLGLGRNPAPARTLAERPQAPESPLESAFAYGQATVDNAYATRGTIGATGKVGEQFLKGLGGQSQVFFRTSQGGRYVDQLVKGIAHESKVGYTSLTKDVSRQIAKDVELIQSGEIRGAVWHFFQSPVTGAGGPSAPLLQALQKAGIGVVTH